MQERRQNEAQGSIDEDALAESRRIVGLQPLHEAAEHNLEHALGYGAGVTGEYRKRLAIFEVFAKGVRDYYARIGDDPNAARNVGLNDLADRLLPKQHYPRPRQPHNQGNVRV
ncbi:g8769 [Coccomyxa viridis]|uniref:G8769 protein n=1 Tax=Coccomyxa viridis TaxID=1274662 RepID=A0ABP1G2A3_9CHLO